MDRATKGIASLITRKMVTHTTRECGWLVKWLCWLKLILITSILYVCWMEYLWNMKKPLLKRPLHYIALVDNLNHMTEVLFDFLLLFWLASLSYSLNPYFGTNNCLKPTNLLFSNKFFKWYSNSSCNSDNSNSSCNSSIISSKR